MSKKTNKELGYMLRNGGGDLCVNPTKINKPEGNEPNENTEVVPDYKWIKIARNVEASLPESERVYHRKHMNEIATDSGQPLPFPEDVNPSKSYIRIVCEEDSVPRFNQIQLRNDPPTLIHLKGGENILPVEAYPDLKFGFSQIDNYIINEGPSEWNGASILEVDLSHFNAEEMTSMDDMFAHMAGLRKIIFGENIINIRTARYAFDRCSDSFDNGAERIMKELDLRNIDFSNAIDLEGMLWGCGAKTINMSGCDLKSVKYISDIFTYCECEVLILDNSKNIVCLTDEFPGIDQEDYFKELSLKGCEEKTIKAFAMAIEENGGNIKLLLDKRYDYKVISSEAGNSECLLIKKCSLHTLKRSYEIVGTVLNRPIKYDISMAIIPGNVTDIAPSAFEGLTSLKCVFIPSSVKTIGNNAFKNCKNLVEIHIPDSVEKIGSDAFSGCVKLKHLFLPDSVKTFDMRISEDLHLNFLRIPFKLLFTGCFDQPYVKIDYLSIGLPEDMNNLGKSWNGSQLRVRHAFSPENFLFSNDQPYVAFESYADSHFTKEDVMTINGPIEHSYLSDKEIICIDGIVIGKGFLPEEELEEYDEWEEESIACAYRIPDHALAVPSGVQRLEEFCLTHILGMHRPQPLFIPESVISIDQNALESGQVLITPANNYSRLKQILPASLGNVWIVEV